MSFKPEPNYASAVFNGLIAFVITYILVYLILTN